jgi:hypothetical protein
MLVVLLLLLVLLVVVVLLLVDRLLLLVGLGPAGALKVACALAQAQAAPRQQLAAAAWAARGFWVAPAPLPSGF